ncbi:MAG: glycosyltransferase family 4 protein [Candidatus Eisenbacteria bacterium]|nr:glycosyltransferase family 4 protein [Candidatus Eisenbacteria bacterium]
MAETPLRLCMYAPLLWPLWSDGRVPFSGGAEVQQAAIARGLAANGAEVSVVTCDFGQPSPTVVHGVTVRSSYRIEAGLPVLRFFHPRLSGAIRAIRATRAQVVYARGATLEAGVAYLAAQTMGVPFVFGAAHEHDAHRSLPEIPNPRDQFFYRRALRGAAVVIAQTEVQRRLFREQFGVEARVIRNMVTIPEHFADAGANETIVWLATYKSSKRPGWFLEAARALPNRRFVMCGVVPRPPDSTEVWEEVQRAAAALPNLEVRGFLGRDEVSDLLRGAALFVHTSPAEGFPNTVLEAWAHGLPTICCTDPDGIIEREQLGTIASDVASLTLAIEEWMTAPERRSATGSRNRAYASSVHSVSAVLAQLIRAFEDAIGRK